jgi:hypothetical protein
MSTVDPNRTLAAMRAALTAGDWTEVADQAQALDYHLSAGGNPPEAWREGPDAPAIGYVWVGWEAETDLGNDDDRDDVYHLTITDPDGEEYATITHRTCGGKYPLNGEVAMGKMHRAERIVSALNGSWREGPDAPLPDPGFSFYNLNEQGEVYDRHDSMSPALDTLAEFPNDIVAIVTTGSPQDALLSSQEAQR